VEGTGPLETATWTSMHRRGLHAPQGGEGAPRHALPAGETGSCERVEGEDAHTATPNCGLTRGTIAGLRRGAFAGVRVGFRFGELSPEEREATGRDFIMYNQGKAETGQRNGAICRPEGP
jgi:hypothetical protein